MKWFGKKSDTVPRPVSRDRYAGNPLLILLENYVLSCIGCLAPDKEEGVSAAVQRVYGGGSDWKATLRSTLHLDNSLDEQLHQMWLKNQQIATQENQTLLPEDFARMVVDDNFSTLIG